MSIRDLVPWNWGKKNVPVRRQEVEDPFRELQRRMNRIFDDFWGDFSLAPFGMSALSGWGDFAPRVEVKETDKEITVIAELPGMDEKDIELILADGALTLEGEKKHENVGEKDGMQYSECSYGSFRRVVPLPCEIDEDKVAAEFRNGILTVTLPKSAQARERCRRIEVKCA